jgi:urea carboxylase-associated protein 2
MSKTATTHGAMEHAREKAAREASAVLAKPTIPVQGARDLPDGVSIDSLCWDEVLGAGDYAARVLEPGTRLRLVDLEGDACLSLIALVADRPAERLCVPDTVKVQWQAYLGRDALLLSDIGRVLLSIVEDTYGNHDALCGMSSPWTNATRYGSGDNHSEAPNARDRFALALAKHGLGRRDIPACVNFFRRVRVGADGSLNFVATPPSAGAFVELRAEMRVLVALTNTPHVLDPRPKYTATPVRLLAWKGPRTAADDPIRLSTPERLRAFESVEDLTS